MALSRETLNKHLTKFKAIRKCEKRKYKKKVEQLASKLYKKNIYHYYLAADHFDYSMPIASETIVEMILKSKDPSWLLNPAIYALRLRSFMNANPKWENNKLRIDKYKKYATDFLVAYYQADEKKLYDISVDISDDGFVSLAVLDNPLLAIKYLENYIDGYIEEFIRDLIDIDNDEAIIGYIEEFNDICDKYGLAKDKKIQSKKDLHEILTAFIVNANNCINVAEGSYGPKYDYRSYDKISSDGSPLVEAAIGNVDGYIDNIKEILDRNSCQPLVNFALGYFLYRKGEYSKALEQLLIAESSNNWRSTYYIGKMYLIQNDYDKCSKYYQKALETCNAPNWTFRKVLESIKTDLEPIGGGDLPFDAIERNYLEKEEQGWTEKSTLLDQTYKTRTGLPELAQTERYRLFGNESNWHKLTEDAKKFIENAGKAYHLTQATPSNANCHFEVFASHYYKAFESILNDKIVTRFKEELRYKLSSKETMEKEILALKDTNIADKYTRRAVENFITTLKKSDWTLSVADIRRVIKLSRKSETPILKAFIKHLDDFCPIMHDDTFLDDMEILAQMRNPIAHERRFMDRRLEDFEVHRETIIGTDKKKGLLYKFLDSYSE